MSQRPRIQNLQSLRLELNPSLQAAIGILRTDAAGLSRFLEEQAAENPHLVLAATPPGAGDWLPRWRGVFGGAGGADPDLVAGGGPSLIAHVTAAIDAMALPPRARRLALALSDALTPAGWLERPPAAIAAEAGASLPEVEAVLTRLQTIEPAGLFARDLADCLRLQAAEMGALDPVMEVILAHLPLLAAGDTARLARLAGADAAAILARFRVIRSMNPKPGTAFSGPGSAPAAREPDLLATPRADGGWDIALNRSALPTLSVTRAAAGDEAQLAAARALRQAVAARNATLLRVGREIAARQQAALAAGAGALVPMTMADLGAALGLHESTISRAVAGASLDTPRGTWWLRRMFSGARRGAGGTAATGTAAPGPQGGRSAPPLSAAALRHRLAGLVAAEDPSRPLSDAALAGRLAAETGVVLPRRTLAQYRTDAGIPPAHRRRRRP